MNFRIRSLYGHFAPLHGIAWIRLGEYGAGWQIKAPWCRPLFSERYGHTRVALRFAGFRISRLAAPPDGCAYVLAAEDIHGGDALVFTRGGRVRKGALK